MCVCVCVCLCDRRRTQSLNQLTNIIQIRYLGTPCKYLLPDFSVFELPLKLRVVHTRKKFKISIFSKMALTIFFKFCVFIVHSKPNNMTPSAFPGKSLKLEKQYLIFCSHVTQRLNQLTNLVQIRYLGPLANISCPPFCLFVFFIYSQNEGQFTLGKN